MREAETLISATILFLFRSYQSLNLKDRLWVTKGILKIGGETTGSKMGSLLNTLLSLELDSATLTEISHAVEIVALAGKWASASVRSIIHQALNIVMLFYRKRCPDVHR